MHLAYDPLSSGRVFWMKVARNRIGNEAGIICGDSKPYRPACQYKTYRIFRRCRIHFLSRLFLLWFQ